jgi:Mn2+/Fe2+ NRAMP family transporter
MAATGVGAGDLAAAAFAGAKYRETLLWAIAGGAIVKFVLTEGVARWQLATGTSLLEGWCRHLGPAFARAFLAYLVFWTFFVAAALMSACGIAAHALWPALPVPAWGALHSIVAVALVIGGRYALFERIMSLLAAAMVVALVASAALLVPSPATILRGFIPSLPSGAGPAVLGLVGGIGGSVTLLAYGYWIREHDWSGASVAGRVRADLTIAYALTGLFGIAVLVLASRALGGSAQDLPAGSRGLVALADTLQGAVGARALVLGAVARVVFLLGVWAAVFTSVLGVWQGIPYIFADLQAARAGRYGDPVDVRSRAYRGYLLYLAFAPMALLLLARPFGLILAYTIVSSAFLPFLAGSLVWLNGRRSLVGDLRNGPVAACALVVALVLVAVLGVQEIWEALSG